MVSKLAQVLLWKLGSPAAKDQVTMECLWIDGFFNPSQELARRGLAHATDEEDEATAFVALLRACVKKKDLYTGTRVHDEILRKGLLKKCSDALVTMYAKCGVLENAQELFDLHKSKDVLTWNALIAGYTRKGRGHDALKYFDWMCHEGIPPNEVTFSCILKACGSIRAADKGEQIHDEIDKQGLLANNIVLGTALLSMYAKCGALTKARRVLEELPVRNVVSWNALITGYANCDEGEQALHCFEQMQCEGILPDAVTFTCILKACGSLRAVDKGARIHDEIAKQGLVINNLVLGNAVVDMYAKCGALTKARRVLEELPTRDVVSWNTLITGYSQQGDGEQALSCFEQMKREGLSPDEVTFICILKACGSIGAADKGEKIHDEIAKQGLSGHGIALGNALVDMYVKCGALAKARRVLEELPARNVISWSTLIAGYAQQGKGEQALNCFEQMKREGHCPNEVTFICMLKACGSIGASVNGELIHNDIAKQGLVGNDVVLDTALVEMYSKCGALARARRVLEELPVCNVGPWNALISGLVQQNEHKQALICFEQMQREGLHLNALTFICILKACGAIGAADKGEQIHDQIAKQGLLGNDNVLGTALVDMYVKCGALTKAQRVLEELPDRDVISWNALIAGYAQHGKGEQALTCLEAMKREGLSPDAVTFICILKAFGSIGAYDEGERVHDEISKQGLLGNDIVLGTALVDMYAKCGALTKARRVLEELPIRDAISWNALIARSVQQGEGKEALKCFEQMQRDGLSPDANTFSCVLSACSRLGLVEDAEMYFVKMSTEYGMNPDLQHYTCMIDLFGRAGHLDKALGVIEKMSSFDRGVWSALLGACTKWGDETVGRWAFENAVQTDKSYAAAYSLMANIYAAAGMHLNAENIETVKIEKKALT